MYLDIKAQPKYFLFHSTKSYSHSKIKKHIGFWFLVEIVIKFSSLRPFCTNNFLNTTKIWFWPTKILDQYQILDPCQTLDLPNFGPMPTHIKFWTYTNPKQILNPPQKFIGPHQNFINTTHTTIWPRLPMNPQNYALMQPT